MPARQSAINHQPPSIAIRPATIADTPAISAIHCSDVSSWKAWDADGSARPARYNDLTPYQRWLNGGPWMDAELYADHLRRLLAGGGLPLIAELDGRLLAEAELHTADEPPPFGRNMNLSVLYVHRNHRGQGLGSALLKHALALAESENCDTFTVANAEAADFYARHGLRPAARYARFRLPAQSSKIRYAVEPLPDTSYDLVRGFALAVGRYQNARHDWERTRPGATPDFPEWRGLRLERCWITAGSRRAALILEEPPHERGAAEAFLFTRNELADDLVVAVRDLATRAGFGKLYFFAPAEFKYRDAVRTEYSQELFLKRLHGGYPSHLFRSPSNESAG